MGYAKVKDWSRLLPSPKSDEVISILICHILGRSPHRQTQKLILPYKKLALVSGKVLDAKTKLSNLCSFCSTMK